MRGHADVVSDECFDDVCCKKQVKARASGHCSMYITLGVADGRSELSLGSLSAYEDGFGKATMSLWMY